MTAHMGFTSRIWVPTLQISHPQYAGCLINLRNSECQPNITCAGIVGWDGMHKMRRADVPVDTTSYEHVTISLIDLHVVREVALRRQHPSLPDGLTNDDHDHANPTEHLQGTDLE
jgi:hypothetical protein